MVYGIFALFAEQENSDISGTLQTKSPVKSPVTSKSVGRSDIAALIKVSGLKL